MRILATNELKKSLPNIELKFWQKQILFKYIAHPVEQVIYFEIVNSKICSLITLTNVCSLLEKIIKFVE